MVTAATRPREIPIVELLPLYLGGFIATFACIVSVTQAVSIPGFAAVGGAVAFIGLALSFWMRIRGVSPNTGLMLVIGLLAVAAISWQLGVTDVVRRQVLVPVPLMGDAGVAVVLALMMVVGTFGALRNEVLAAILVPGLAAQGVMGGAVLAGEIVLSFLVFLLAAVYVLASVHYLRWRAADGVPRKPDPIVWARNNAMVSLQVFVGTLALGALFSVGFGISLGRLLSLFQPQVQQLTRELAPEQIRHAWLEFADSFDLGRGPVSLSDDPVMYVNSPETGLWRARVYGQYDRGRWSATKVAANPGVLTTDGIVAIQATPLQVQTRTIEQQFRMVAPTTQLYASGRPTRVELLSARRDATIYPADEGYSLQVQPPAPLYRMSVELPQGAPPPVAYLESETAALRPWMDFPGNLDPQVLTLARQIIGAETAPARQAGLIADYLRTHYTYKIDPKPMPPNVEPVSYFLLTQREGFCEIYAATMVVLLRTLHIPSRVAVGYATGEWDDQAKAYLVRMNMAHAWVEAYLPGFGWTEYDPTPPGYVPPASPLPRERVGQAPWWSVIGRLALPGTLISLGMALLVVAFWPRWRVRRAAVVGRSWGRAEQLIFAAYRTTLEWLGRAGLRRRWWETPREFAARCHNRMAGTALGPLVPALDELTAVFVHARYATGSNEDAAAHALHARLTIQGVLRRERRAARALRRRLAHDGDA